MLLREYDHLILRVTSGPTQITALTGALDQYDIFFTYTILIIFCGMTTVSCDNFFQATLLHVFGYVIFITASSEGARTLTVTLHIGQLKLTVFHQTQRVLMLVLGFGTKSGNDVCRNITIGKDFTNTIELTQIPLTGIGTVHHL